MSARPARSFAAAAVLCAPHCRSRRRRRAHRNRPSAISPRTRSRCTRTLRQWATARGHGELPAFPPAAEHRPEAARRGDAPPRRPAPRCRRDGAHGERGHAASTSRAGRPSSSTPHCSRPTRTTRATIRCCTSCRAPTRPPDSRSRLSRRSIASCSATRRRRDSTRCSSVAGSCCSPPSATPRPSSLRGGHRPRPAARASTSRASTSTAGRCSSSR